MSKHGKPFGGQGQPGKPEPSTGISQELPQLRSKIDAVEKTLQETLVEKNQWNAEVKSWLGKTITVVLVYNQSVTGELRWVDRYTLCVFGKIPGSPHMPPRSIVVHKGAVALMYLNEVPIP